MTGQLHRESVATYWVEIAIAGDYDDARRICREHCERGLCVTITRTQYIYTGGEESGVVVRLINYPRFPRNPDALRREAETLANALRQGLCQDSFSIIAPDLTAWFSRRHQGSPDV